jgi:hypothetical protein
VWRPGAPDEARFKMRRSQRRRSSSTFESRAARPPILDTPSGFNRRSGSPYAPLHSPPTSVGSRAWGSRWIFGACGPRRWALSFYLCSQRHWFAPSLSLPSSHSRRLEALRHLHTALVTGTHPQSRAPTAPVRGTSPQSQARTAPAKGTNPQGRAPRRVFPSRSAVSSCRISICCAPVS